MKAKSFNISVQGASHIRKNKVCQDSSKSSGYNAEENGFYYAVVCDGHGGDDYIRSEFGSKFAAEAAGDRIWTFMEQATTDLMRKDADRQLRYLTDSIVHDWRQRVREHVLEFPFTDEELEKVSAKARDRYSDEANERYFPAYGTTLIAVAWTDNYWFGIHIGDGKCVAVDKSGQFFQPIPWDSQCYLNVTTSMCDKNAVNNFRHCYSTELPAAVFVASDGIDDCFTSDEKMYNLYRTMLYSINKNGLEETVAEFKDYLPRMSAQGSGDDMSVAAILNLEAIAKFTGLQEQMEAQKQAVIQQRQEEERARQAALAAQAAVIQQQEAARKAEEAAVSLTEEHANGIEEMPEEIADDDVEMAAEQETEQIPEDFESVSEEDTAAMPEESVSPEELMVENEPVTNQENHDQLEPSKGLPEDFQTII